MLYRQTSSPDWDRIQRALAELLAIDLQHVESAFESHGYSGGVHRLDVQDDRGRSYSLLLKAGSAERSYQFFRDVLDPCELNSPQMYGVIEGGDASYLVMQYIPHQPPDWTDPRKYRRAVDWLAHKDRVAEQQRQRISQLDYVLPFELGDLNDRIAAIRWAVQERLDSLLTPRLVQAIESNRCRFEQAAVQIRSGPQTWVHNDFQMLNILFASGSRQGQLYVIDWTFPAIGSVFIDLATLVHVAPPEIQSELIQRYLAAGPAQDCEVVDFAGQDFAGPLAAAQMHVHLSILSWMIDALRSGQQHAVARPKMRALVEQLQQYFEQSSGI